MLQMQHVALSRHGRDANLNHLVDTIAKTTVTTC